jgi:amino acid adenylation domain-containing protein
VTFRHLAEYLEQSAEQYPNRIAIVEPSGATTTYAELNRQSDALAAFLCARGVKCGDRVALALAKGIPAVVSLFAILKAGAAYVPVDLTAPPERARQILRDCEISALMIEGHALDLVTDWDTLKAVVSVGAAPGSRSTPFEEALHSTDLPPSGRRHPEDLAYIIFTSGSTGVPKGAMITHANALSFIDWCSNVFAITPSDRVSNYAPFHFDYSVLDLYLPLKHGASVYLISDQLAKRPRDLARFIAEHQLTVWGSTPSALMLLLQFGDLDAQGPWSLRLVTFGGEVFPATHLRELQRHWPSATYFNMYGPTEITTACTFARIPSRVPDDREAAYPIGFPCSHCQALVLDDEGREVAAGGEGLLYISGPSVFAGYWKRPVETAAVLLERDGVRWYNTGDVVRWDPAEGFTYVGRKDRMIKRRGYRIELGEIEQALYSHARIREVAAVSVADERLGVSIVAFLTYKDEHPSVVQLKSYCASKIPAYMVPDRFIFQDRLPRTSAGKVDYQALKAHVGDGRGR